MRWLTWGITVAIGALWALGDGAAAAAHAASDPVAETIGSAAVPGTVEWPQVGGDVQETHFGSSSRIDTSNVNRLGLAWSFPFETNRGEEATPVESGGVLYVTSAWARVYALDATTGALLWSYDPLVPGATAFKACCDVVNRGVAVADGRVFVGTLDGRLIALEAATGHVLWTVMTVDADKPYTITGAPRVFKDMVIIGNGGSEYGVRGFVTAYSVSTGQLKWRFYTVPGDPDKPRDGVASDRVLADIARPTWSGHWYEYGGGGTVWDAIVFDPELNQIYIGVGNGTPWDRRVRSQGRGDNLFLASIVALDADSGAYRWHYQASPGESWDFDADQNLILTTLAWRGRSHSVLMQASKNGFFYVIERRSGKLLSAAPFVTTNWTTGIDMKNGRPRPRGDIFYRKPFLMLPNAVGGHNWQPMAFDPGTGLVYIPAQDLPLRYAADEHFTFRPGAWNAGIDMSAMNRGDDAASRAISHSVVLGALIAWNPVTQREAWRVTHAGMWNGGILATAGNLVFQGEGSGVFNAFRATDGVLLWHFAAPSGVMAAPATYEINGRQYVAVLCGWGGIMVNGTAGAGPREAPVGRVLVFALDADASLPTETHSMVSAANPAQEIFSNSQISEGADRYLRNCAVCHGWDPAAPGDIVPDLRRASALSDAALWHSIVLDGVLSNAGMVGFKSYLTAAEAEAIRAYISRQAEQLRAGAQPLAH